MIDTQSSTMSCCVPGCTELLQGWATGLPHDSALLSRWKEAIQAGTGHCLEDQNIHNGTLMCSLHFEVKPPNDCLTMDQVDYQEPSLFYRDHILLQVTSCRLCLRYDATDNMYNMADTSLDGHSLAWLANKYFKILQINKEKGMFCESCTVRIDATHALWREMNQSAKEYRKLLKKMPLNKIQFKYTSSTDSSPNMGKAVSQHCALWQEVPLENESTSTFYYREQVADNMAEIPQKIFVKSEPRSAEEECSNIGTQDDFKENPFEDQNTNIAQKDEEMVDALDSIIIKEEPKLDSGEQPQTTEVPEIPLATTDETQNSPVPMERPKYKCYICNTILPSKSSQIDHLLIDHKAQESYHCVQCGEQFRNIRGFNFHLGKHDTERRLPCSHCPLRFNTYSAKLNHETIKHGIDHGRRIVKKVRKRYKCWTCGKTYCSKIELNRHEQVQHKGEAYARCKLCNKSFAAIKTLETHLKTHHSEEPRKCRYCETYFQRQQDLDDHIQEEHNGGASYPEIRCTICGDEFISQRALFVHRQTHSETAKKTIAQSEEILAVRHGGTEKVPTCNVCKATFKHSKEVVTHFQEVHPEANFTYYPCDDCDEVFFSTQSMRYHTYFHSDKFRCDQCDKRHYSKVTLDNHRFKVHGIHRTADCYLKCPICHKEFIRGGPYGRHVRTHNNKDYCCDQCDKRYRFQHQLVVHQRSHSGERPLVCPKCSKGFANPTSFHRHKKRCFPTT